MRPTIFIDGNQGTTGLDLQHRLGGRPDLGVITLPPDLRKNDEARRAALNDCDIAMLCLPDAAARDAVGMIEAPHVRVIDASSAHRTSAGWIYGLPELDAEQPQRIREARRVSNPGCYPTAAISLLRPLLDAALIPRDRLLTIHAVSGYSGRGRAGVEQFEAGGEKVPGLQVYGLGLQHKHVPEILMHSGLTARPLFVPAYGAFRQGIVLTIPLHYAWLAPGATGASLRDCLAERYAGSAYVRVDPLMNPDAPWELQPDALNGTNDLVLTVAANDATGQVVLSAVLDNLGKGAAGAAVQNLDLILSR